MTAKWNNEHSAEFFCKRLEEARTGSNSFNEIEYRSNIAAISNLVSLNNGISDLQKRNFVIKAVSIVSKIGVIRPASLITEINKFEKQFLSQTPKRYILFTSLSIDKFFKLKRQIINGCILTFKSDIPKAFRNSIKEIEKNTANIIFDELPNNYLVVQISVKGKSYFEAAEKALDAIDLFRGIWNLFYNGKTLMRYSTVQSREPINKIILGPLHTLHPSSLKSETPKWWYESDYFGPTKTINPSNDIDSFYKFQKRIKKLLRRSHFKEFIESAIIRYSRSLDQRNWNNAFLNLWALLETLTNTGENDTHKDTVQRTSFFFEDDEYMKQILNILRNCRNKAVHDGEGNENIETFLFQLKYCVESALKFLIANEFNFKNLSEVRQFLELPHDKITLTKRLHILKSAMKYRKCI